MMRSRSGRCVVWDLDDTLYDEIDFVRSGFSAVAAAVQERFGVDCRRPLDECLRTGKVAGAFQSIVKQSGLLDGVMEFMLDTYRYHYPAH